MIYSILNSSISGIVFLFAMYDFYFFIKYMKFNAFFVNLINFLYATRGAPTQGDSFCSLDA